MHLAAISALLGLLALPALAQHGFARGGFGGHAAPAPHGFSAPAPRAFSGGFSRGFASRGPIGLRPGGFGPARTLGTRGPVAFRPASPRLGRSLGPMRFAARSGMTSRMPYRRFGGAADHGRYPRGPHQPGDHDRDHDRDRHHHRIVYWNGFLYPYWYSYPNYPIFTGYVDPWLFGPDDYDQEHPATADAYQQGYPQGPYSQGPTEPYAPDSSAAEPDTNQPYRDPDSAPQQPTSTRRPYTGNTAGTEVTSQGASSSSGLHRPPLTVIFTDGRPAEQFQNYLITADTLTVFEPQYRRIPLNQVNVSATEAANQAAGIDFRPPGR